MRDNNGRQAAGTAVAQELFPEVWTVEDLLGGVVRA